MNRQTIGRVLAVAVLTVTPLMAVACAEHHHHEGPAQHVGREIDHGLDKAGDAVEDAGRKVNHALPGD